MADNPNDTTRGGVEESDDITLIDPRKLDAEARKIREAEKLADRKEEVERRLIQSEKKLLALGISPLRTDGSIKPDDSRQVPKTGKAPVGSPSNTAKLEKEIAELKEQIKDLGEFTKKIESKFDTVEEKLGEASRIASDPVGYIVNIFTKSGFITKLLGTAGAAIALYEIVLSAIEKAFGVGGPFDIGVRVRDELKAFGPLQKILDIRSGKIFFSPDTSIYQGVAMSSNTSKLAGDMQRFNRLHAGTMIGDTL